MNKEIFDYNDYNYLSKRVKLANQRIQKIQSRYGEGAWGIANLYEKIDNNTVRGISPLTGGIKISRNMSDAQLRAIQTATEAFLASDKTTKLRNIKKVISETKNTLQATLGDEAHKITDAEIDKLYNIVENRDTRVMAEKIGASNLWTSLVEAKEENKSKGDFYNIIAKNSQVDITDDDMLDFLNEMYDKYVV